MALFVVLYCYVVSNLKQYILPKCWYPPIKLRSIDTIGYLQFLSHVAYFNVIKLQFFLSSLIFLLIIPKKKLKKFHENSNLIVYSQFLIFCHNNTVCNLCENMR